MKPTAYLINVARGEVINEEALVQALSEHWIAGAALDVSRAVTRRAERIVARLIHQGECENIEVLRYLNRLSSLLFVLARYEETVSGLKQTTQAKPQHR